MLVVVARKGKNSLKVITRLDDTALETATAIACETVKHNKVKCNIFIEHNANSKPLLLKQVKLDWRGRVRIK